jgi:hypothetical protein
LNSPIKLIFSYFKWIAETQTLAQAATLEQNAAKAKNPMTWSLCHIQLQQKP